jgi:hypothetical protein
LDEGSENAILTSLACSTMGSPSIDLFHQAGCQNHTNHLRVSLSDLLDLPNTKQAHLGVVCWSFVCRIECRMIAGTIKKPTISNQ